MNILKFFLLLISLSTIAQAKDLYVAPNGDDSTSYANNDANSPWASIGRAVWGSVDRSNPLASEAAMAGDVVNITAGTYTATQGTGERYLPIWNPVNSGSNGSPITIQGINTVILQSTTNGEGEPLIGAYNKSYVIWDNFILDESNIHTKSDTGPVVVWDSSNITIQNLSINGVSSSWNDNHSAIRLEQASDTLIKSNTIQGFYNAGDNRNGSAIITYSCDRITFEDNEIFDSSGGIFIKGAVAGPNTGIIIRNNLLYDFTTDGISIGVVGDTGIDGVTAYQNIIRDARSGITLIGYAGNGTENIELFNNTIHNTINGILFKPDVSEFSSISLFNNIVAGSSIGLTADLDLNLIADLSFSHNLYFNNTTFSQLNFTSTSFLQWQANFNQDTTGSTDNIDPLFNNEESNDFTLRTDSPALTAAISGGAVGADSNEITGIDPDQTSENGNNNSSGSGGCFFCW